MTKNNLIIENNISNKFLNYKLIKKISKNYKKTLVILDSNHTHDHVLKELNLYSQLVSKNSYCVVFDTVINEMPNNYYLDREWNKSNNPMTAITEFLKKIRNLKLIKKLIIN